MRIKKKLVASSTCNKTTLITRNWGNDGWCYIPELKVRQRFFTTDLKDVFELKSEKWDGIMPLPAHEERVSYFLLSEKPLVWEESWSWGCERYEETKDHTSTLHG